MWWSVRSLSKVIFEVPTKDNILTALGLDLTEMPHHGGSTLSSGALPKWDLFNKKFMIKRASFDEFGDVLTDSINEVLVYRFCNEIGVSCAEYFPATIKYRDNDTKKIVVSPAVITRIFNGLVHYRDVRVSLGLGRNVDELLEIYQYFDIKTELNDMLAIDYFFGQQDRHSKNIGFVGTKLSPLFDSGACLYYDIKDDMLASVDITRMQNHKTFAKPLSDLIIFSHNHITNEFTFFINSSYLISKFEKVLEDFK